MHGCTHSNLRNSRALSGCRGLTPGPERALGPKWTLLIGYSALPGRVGRRGRRGSAEEGGREEVASRRILDFSFRSLGGTVSMLLRIFISASSASSVVLNPRGGGEETIHSKMSRESEF